MEFKELVISDRGKKENECFFRSVDAFFSGGFIVLQVSRRGRPAVRSLLRLRTCPTHFLGF